MMYRLYDGYEGWSIGGLIGWFGGGIMMIVMMTLMIALIIWVVRASEDNHPHSSSHALAILKERYARGEITRGQFEEMKKDIR